MKDPSSTTPVNAVRLQTAADGLMRHLQEARAGLTRLIDLTGEKLTALRNADAAALTELTRREAALLQDVLRSEQKRPAFLAALAQELQRPELATQRARDLADATPEPLKGRLHAEIAATREMAQELKEKNALVGDVARGLQRHIRAVFTEVAQRQTETTVYGHRGQQHGVAKQSTLVDATG